MPPTPEPTDPAAARAADPVFDLHRGGKMEIASTVALDGRDDLSMAYTPGVARVCEAIAAEPGLVDDYTWVSNTVAVVTDGTAVLGLGDIGPAAAMPVMEGKAVLFKQFGGVDAVPDLPGHPGRRRDRRDRRPARAQLRRHQPRGHLGAALLRDRAAAQGPARHPRLPRRPARYGGRRARRAESALRITGRDVATARIVISGAGAAGVAVARILLAAGVTDLAVTDRRGVLHSARGDLTPVKQALAVDTADRTGRTGLLADVLDGADVYIGVSGGTVPEEVVAPMAPDAIIFGLANPTPEVHPEVAHRHARVVATGRSDFPNQINNVLAFPGIFRGAFDVRATAITEGMKLAAADALAALVGDDLAEDYIVPSPFDPRVGAGRGCRGRRRAGAPAPTASPAAEPAPGLGRATGPRVTGLGSLDAVARVGSCSPSTQSPSPPTSRCPR